MGFVGMTA